ncbi:MAG: hypothetical protein MUD02_08610 [Bacteroidales bacterium]|jgi:hypothetical protein|nr:hypothetical protein [Bacteroidales bacterium]MCU0408995.1 hypothetical protein [Bacteroidales bacterium]
MTRTFFFLTVLMTMAFSGAGAQTYVKTADLFRRDEGSPGTGKLTIVQNPSIDTLISRYILYNRNQEALNGHQGLEGFRIQIYGSSGRSAREESGKARAAFLGKFKDIVSYQLFAEPGYWYIRVGDYRTKAEAKKYYVQIIKAFPDAYIVPDFINYPDLNIN